MDSTIPLDSNRDPSDSVLTRRQVIGLIGGALALPLASANAASATAASTQPVPTPPAPVPALPASPDLPNFHPMMEWLAREHAPGLSFLDDRWSGSSLEAWKAVARPVLRERLSYNPKPLPLAAELVRREEREGFAVEEVKIHATPAYHIPAHVLVPKQKRGNKLPAVLALHCHSGRYVWGHEKVLSSPGESQTLTEFRKGTYGRPWAEALVRRGYLVIAIDAFYFGERRLRVEDLERNRVVLRRYAFVPAGDAGRGVRLVGSMALGRIFHTPSDRRGTEGNLGLGRPRPGLRAKRGEGAPSP